MTVRQKEPGIDRSCPYCEAKTNRSVHQCQLVQLGTRYADGRVLLGLLFDRVALMTWSKNKALRVDRLTEQAQVRHVFIRAVSICWRRVIGESMPYRFPTLLGMVRVSKAVATNELPKHYFASRALCNPSHTVLRLELCSPRSAQNNLPKVHHPPKAPQAMPTLSGPSTTVLHHLAAICDVKVAAAFKILFEKFTTPSKAIELYQCAYCYENKPKKRFRSRRRFPNTCGAHMYKVICKNCVARALSAQLDTRHPKKLACPSCAAFWEPDHLYLNMFRRDRMRYRDLLRIEAVAASYCPPDEESLQLLIKQRSRLCPWCMKPFQQISGCGEMVCGHCKGRFLLESTLTVEDMHTRYLLSLLE